MDGGKANHYDDAARWVHRARDAYRTAGQEEEWQTYYHDLLLKHGRKYKLIPLLRALGDR